MEPGQRRKLRRLGISTEGAPPPCHAARGSLQRLVISAEHHAAHIYSMNHSTARQVVFSAMGCEIFHALNFMRFSSGLRRPKFEPRWQQVAEVVCCSDKQKQNRGEAPFTCIVGLFRTRSYHS